MTDYLQIEAYHVPIRYQTDVCVVGAGPAGVAAAVAACRLGLTVLLIEKHGFCGGATVAGLSGTICGLFSSGSNPEQIVFGFADEFYQLLKKKNGVTEPVKFGKTLLVPHDALAWKEVADELLQQVGCTVLFHVNFLNAITEKGKITHLIAKGPEGQFAIQPKCVIDASGDAEVVNSMSDNTNLANNGLVQTPTMIFKMGNVQMEDFFKLDPSEIDKAVIAADKSGKYRLPRHHVYIFPLPNKREVLCNMTKITYPDGSVPLAISSTDLTYAEIEGRKQAREYSRFLIDTFQAFKDSFISDTGAQIGIRQSRTIKGIKTLSNADVLQATKDAGAITHSAWPIELHGAGELKIQYLENDYYDIPFETLVPLHSKNLVVAGRCFSAEHEALASARVTAQCFGMGYAAGAACDIIIKENKTAAEISGIEVNEWMKAKGLRTAKD